jgi:hypothetical protein
MHFAPSGTLYSFLLSDLEWFGSLADLALDMHWSWNHCTRLSARRFRKEVDELLHSNRPRRRLRGFSRVHDNVRLGGAVPLETGRLLWQR